MAESREGPLPAPSSRLTQLSVGRLPQTELGASGSGTKENQQTGPRALLAFPAGQPRPNLVSSPVLKANKPSVLGTVTQSQPWGTV